MKVLADGVDVRELDAQWFRSQLGVVSQEPALFSDSVAANICYGLPGTTRVGTRAHMHVFNLHDHHAGSSMMDFQAPSQRMHDPWDAGK